MRKYILLASLVFISSCSSEHEPPAMELNIERGNLSVAEVASTAIFVGVSNGFSGGVKDKDQMGVINQDVPAAFIWLNNGVNPAATVSTLVENDKIQIWLFSSGIPDSIAMKEIADQFAQAYELSKHNKRVEFDAQKARASHP